MKSGNKWKKWMISGMLCSCVMIIPIMICGCGRNGEEKESAAGIEKQEKTEAIRIGLSVDSFVLERWIRDRDVFVSTAKELGAEVNVQDAGGDILEQISQVEYFIDKKMDAIVVIARDCDEISGVLKKAKEAGIKTVSYDRMVHNADSDLYLSFDNYSVGTLMAEAMMEAIPEGGDIFMIHGSEEDDNVSLVYDGFMESIGKSNLDVVYEANCPGWISEYAIEYVETALDEYPDVKGIMCGNDDIASQVVKVLSEKQMAGDVIVVGQDGDLAACQRIVEGTQYMTAFKDIDDLAKTAAEYVIRIVKEESASGITEIRNDGKYDIPAVILEPIAVKKENMDEVIVKGGFHTREDVYLNVGYIAQ